MSEEKKKLTPVSVLLSSTYQTWSKNLLKFIRIYLWGLLYALIPFVVLFSLMLLNTLSGLRHNVVFMIISIFIGLIAVLFLIYFLIRTIITQFILIKHDYHGQELALYRESAHYFWSYLWLKFLIALIIFLWLLFLIIPLFLFFIIPWTVATIVLLLAFIPAFIFIVFYLLAVYVFFFENKKSLSAIKRSRILIKNYWWPMAGRFLLIIALTSLIELIISWPLNYLSTGSLWTIIYNILINIIIYLILPFILLFFYRLYRDLVKIKD